MSSISQIIGKKFIHSVPERSFYDAEFEHIEQLKRFLERTSKTDSLKQSEQRQAAIDMLSEYGVDTTPYSNTGSKCQIISHQVESWIDFVQGTCQLGSLEQVNELCEFIMQFLTMFPIVDIETPFHAGILWQHQLQSVAGVKIGWNPPKGNSQDEQYYHVWLSLPGAYLRYLGLKRVWRLLRGLLNVYSFKCNRIDSKVRDWAKRKMPSDILRYAQDGYISGVQTAGETSSFRIGCQPISTCYLGSFESDKMVRIYDAKPVHGDDAVDWELQMRRKKAQEFVRNFCNIEPDYDDEDTYQILARFTSGAVCGSIKIHSQPIWEAEYDEFTGQQKSKRKEGQRTSRVPLQDWWQEFCDECGGIVYLSCGREPRTVDRTMEWFRKQVFVFLAATREALGKNLFMEWLNYELDKAKERFKPIHELFIYCIKEFFKQGIIEKIDYEVPDIFK